MFSKKHVVVGARPCGFSIKKHVVVGVRPCGFSIKKHAVVGALSLSKYLHRPHELKTILLNSRMPAFVTEYPQFFTASIKGFYKLLEHDKKTLDKLKIGDMVSGTAELEKDVKYEFHWP